MPSRLVMRRLVNVATGVASQRVTLDAYPNDETISWRHIMARVVGDKNDLVEIGFRSGVSDYQLVSQEIRVNGESLTWSGNIPGSGDYRIYAQFKDAQADQLLELTAFGVLELDW